MILSEKCEQGLNDFVWNDKAGYIYAWLFVITMTQKFFFRSK